MAELYELYTTLLYQPILNLLIFLYNVVPANDLGLAIIALTIIIKLALFPLSKQSIKSQKALQELQPKIDEVKKKYKDNKEQQAKALMDLYKNNKVNPLSSCLPLLVQLPFLIAVFQVFRTGLNVESMNLLYPFVQNPGELNQITFGLIDLSKPNIILAVMTGAAQFLQTKMLMSKRPEKPVSKGAKDEDMMALMNKQMLYFMPLITVVIGATLPAGLILYWFITTILTVAQQHFMFRKKPVEMEDKVEVINQNTTHIQEITSPRDEDSK